MARLSKVALGLSGGGFGGYLFEIGALTALDDAFDPSFTTNDFDRYVGVSAGASAASLLANGVRPEEILRANLSGKRPYYFERRDISAPAMGEGLRTFVRAAQQFIPLLKLFYQNRKEMSFIDLLDKAQDALPSGVYSLEPFARYLEATFAAKGLSNSFEGLWKELYIPAIDLETGQTVIFGEGKYRDVPISRAICASSAAPVYFCPVRIEGHDYIDGGVGDVAFFDMRSWKDVEFMLLINPTIPVQSDPTGKDMRKAKRRGGLERFRGFQAIGDQASRINFHARFSQAIRLFRAEHPDKELFVVSPKSTETLLLKRNFLNFRDRVYLLQCGYETVVELLKERAEESQERFARNGMVISLPKLEERMGKRLEEFGAQRRSIPSYRDNALSVAG